MSLIRKKVGTDSVSGTTAALLGYNNRSLCSKISRPGQRSFCISDFVRSMRIVHFSVLTIFRKIILLIIICIIPLCHQVEEFAHINGWEAYPDEENTTDKSSSKTSSRVSTPIGEVDSKKTEAEVKTEAKEAKTEKKEDETSESKPAAMEVDKDEPGMKSNFVLKTTSSHLFSPITRLFCSILLQLSLLFVSLFIIFRRVNIGQYSLVARL